MKEDVKLYLMFIFTVIIASSPSVIYAEKKTEIITTDNETELNFLVEVEEFLIEGLTTINFTVILKALQEGVHSIDGMIIVFQIKNSQSVTYLFEDTITSDSLSLSEENDSRSEISQFYYYREWGRISNDLSLIIHENVTGSTLELNDPNWISTNFNDFLTLKPDYFLRKHYYVVVIGAGIIGITYSFIRIRKRIRKRVVTQPQKIVSYCTRCGTKAEHKLGDMKQLDELMSYCPSCAEYYVYYGEKK